MSRGRVVARLAGLLGVAASALALSRYRRDIRRARLRAAAGSRIAETARGPVEYAMAGDGPPVLVVHGAGGGVDQAMFLAEPLVRSGFRVISMSRFGYLRTPLPADASAEAQADAHASLLDALGIRRSAVLGASAGAPSSMQLALRHPDRVAALVLLVPAAYPFQVERTPAGAMPERLSKQTRFLFDTVLRADFLFWAARRVARRTMTRGILATPLPVVEHASETERERLDGVMDRLLPVSSRRLGLLNDAAIVSSLPRYDLERIAAPTLIVSVEDCLFRTAPSARYSADHIPGAQLVSYPEGGHLWVGHQSEIMAEIAHFLRSAGDAGGAHASAEPR
jgi:2-hydroxy-6-oxonona-2,4-dienedioate hydrolase